MICESSQKKGRSKSSGQTSKQARKQARKCGPVWLTYPLRIVLPVRVRLPPNVCVAHQPLEELEHVLLAEIVAGGDQHTSQGYEHRGAVPVFEATIVGPVGVGRAFEEAEQAFGAAHGEESARAEVETMSKNPMASYALGCSGWLAKRKKKKNRTQQVSFDSLSGPSRLSGISLSLSLSPCSLALSRLAQQLLLMLMVGCARSSILWPHCHCRCRSSSACLPGLFSSFFFSPLEAKSKAADTRGEEDAECVYYMSPCSCR